MVFVHFNPQRKVQSLHGWCIPAQGKDYEVKDKDAIEVSPNTEGAELISDVKYKVLRIPASDPGNIVGYEYEVEAQPFFLQDMWDFQGTEPVRESRYSLQIPPGWEYKASWLNYPEVKPAQASGGLAQWAVTDIKAIRREPEMPPRDGVAGKMIVSLFPPGGPALNGFADWDGMGRWYANLVSGRMEASPPIKAEVTTLTAPKATPLQKMQALAEFVQRDIRYVAIELGIGGWQPHPATDVFSHRYGDCRARRRSFVRCCSRSASTPIT
jgi:transglutaminase-like putative cysteine protease